MRSLRSDFTDTDMVAAIRSKCSDVKKILAIHQRKKNQATLENSELSQSFGSKRRSYRNGHASSSTLSLPDKESTDINGVKTENASSYYRNGITLNDDSSSEYFQEME